MNKEKTICIGQILGAHGVRGLCKLASFTSDPEDVVSYGVPTDDKGKRKFPIELQSWNKTHFIARIGGIETREQAESLKGTKLYVPRDALPAADDGQYYYTDLIGLEARLADGSVYGKVVDVKDFGAGDILEVTRPGGTELLPFNNMTVPEVHIDKGYLLLDPPTLIDGDEEEQEV